MTLKVPTDKRSLTQLPEFEEVTGAVVVTFRVPVAATAGEVTGEVTGEVKRLLAVMKGEMKRQEIQAALGLKHDEHFRTAFLVPALKAGLIEMTIPDKPRSSKQQYRLSAMGRRFVKKSRGRNV